MQKILSFEAEKLIWKKFNDPNTDDELKNG